MELINGEFETFPKEMQDLIVSKRKWISEVENKPAEFSISQRIFCNDCKRETNHNNLYHLCSYCYLIAETEPFSVKVWFGGYRLWRCAGCESFAFEKYDTEEIFDFHEKLENLEDEQDWLQYIRSYPETIRSFYPKRSEYSLVPKRFRQLSVSLNKIYIEIINSYNYEIPMSCAIGIRALVEGICSDHEITGRNLEKKIDGLVNILPKNIVVNLHNLRFMGNEAAHELSEPNQEELKLAIEICEDLLNFLYDLEYKTTSLNQIREKKKIERRDK